MTGIQGKTMERREVLCRAMGKIESADVNQLLQIRAVREYYAARLSRYTVISTLQSDLRSLVKEGRLFRFKTVQSMNGGKGHFHYTTSWQVALNNYAGYWRNRSWGNKLPKGFEFT